MIFKNRVIFNEYVESAHNTPTFGCSVAPQGALLFTLKLASPNLRNTVFPPFFKSEQGTAYGNGLREEPRDP